MTHSQNTTSTQQKSSEDKPLVNFDLSSSLSEIDKHLTNARNSTAHERLDEPDPEILVDTSHVVEAAPSIVEYTPPQEVVFQSGFLAELAKEAANKQGVSQTEAQAQKIRSQNLNDALNRIVSFFSSLAQFANDMEPDISRSYNLDARTCYSNLKWTSARTDSRKEDLSSSALIAFVTFTVFYRAPEPVMVTRPWHQLDALKMELENLKLKVLNKDELDPKKPKHEWLKVRLSPDLPIFLRFQANYIQGHIEVLILNVPTFGVNSYVLKAEEVDTPLLEEIGRVLLSRSDTLPSSLKPV